MSKWNETGILRKKQVKDNYDDLLVFGYACKLFRDDEKAIYIDQGKHLIPWMADEKLKIDRYDGRGALSDLASCEASKEGFDAMRWLGLSDSERKIEQLCDEERYYSLHTNEEEEAMYKEEEMKRKQTNEFQYSYDVPRDPEKENSQDSIPTCEEEVKPFVTPTELDVPVDINIPKTYKENARIEKTAVFVSKQGPQMEILIKAKQADNPQFNFMNQSDPLYKYYRHVLNAIKAGRYYPQTDEQKEEQKETEHLSEEHYLHPSLGNPSLAASTPPPPVSALRLPQIPYKPAADCAYTQLVTRIQGQNLENNGTPPPPPSTQESQMTIEQQQQYYQYYYSMQYYEYYKQIAQQYAAQAGCDPQTILQNPQLQEQIQTQAAHYAQVAYNQYMQQPNPYAQIVTNLIPNIKDNIPVAPPSPQPFETAVKQPNSLAALANYDSDTEDDEEEETKVTFTVPPEETAKIIDKMANYVSKNGVDFESIVRAKGDPRFEFLRQEHEYYKYYKHKLNEYKSPEKKPKEKKVITPVSFSIKKPKDEASKEIKSALPIEESDEEESVPEKEATPPSATTSPIPKSPEPVKSPEVITPMTPPPPPPIKEKTPEIIIEEKPQSPEVLVKKITNGRSIIELDDPILEMIDLTDDIEERRDIKRAEDKIKDKLAMAAKEKLSSRSKDRALQLERRKRAAMFLKMKGESESEKRTIVKVDEGRRRVEDRLDCKKEEILKIDDSESEEGEIRKEKKSRKKKSHKRKSSRSHSRHDSKSHRKKSKKHRRRSISRSSSSSAT